MTVMINAEKRKRITFGDLANYRIVVEGTLDSDWRHRLGDLSIDGAIDDDGVWVTTIAGEFADQAALNGLIHILYDLHLPIIRIEQIQDDIQINVDRHITRPD